MIVILKLLWSECVETMSDVSTCFYISHIVPVVCYYHFSLTFCQLYVVEKSGGTTDRVIADSHYSLA